MVLLKKILMKKINRLVAYWKIYSKMQKLKTDWFFNWKHQVTPWNKKFWIFYWMHSVGPKKYKVFFRNIKDLVTTKNILNRWISSVYEIKLFSDKRFFYFIDWSLKNKKKIWSFSPFFIIFCWLHQVSTFPSSASTLKFLSKKAQKKFKVLAFSIYFFINLKTLLSFLHFHRILQKKNSKFLQPKILQFKNFSKNSKNSNKFKEFKEFQEFKNFAKIAFWPKKSKFSKC